MAILYTKTYNDQTINITDEFSAELGETYANEGRTAYQFHAYGVASGINSYWETPWDDTMSDPWIARDGGNEISSSGPWMQALYFDEDVNLGLVLKIAQNAASQYNPIVFGDRSNHVPGNAMWNPAYSSNMQCSFCTNVPIFETEAEALEYIEETSELERKRLIEDKSVNYIQPEFEKETERYFIIAEMETVNVYKGQVSVAQGSTKTYRTTKFYANTRPSLYFTTGTDFQLGLIAPEVVSGYSLPSPESVFEQVPETSWNDYSIGYTGNYYTAMSYLIGSDYDYPADGTYTYATYFYTNIPILKNEAAAEEAINTGDYSDAVNWDNVSGGVIRYPDFGQKETTTTFGDGTFSSPFVSQYVMSASDVRAVSSIFFDDDQGLIDDIKKGLELFGAKPVDAIMSLVAFPFDVTNIANCSPQSYIYFGSYQHNLASSVNKIYNQLSNYLNAGTIYLAPLFGSWRDYKNLTLSVYLPYIGWRDLEVEKYVKRSVNVRYYVDINSRQCCAVLVADGIMADYWVGEIGVELPIVGSNFADYARSALQHVGNTAKGMINPFSLGGASNIANASANMPGGITGMINKNFEGSALSNYSQYKFGQNGSPKDIQMTKGSFSSGLGMYLPQYVMFRYDIHDVVEPELLNKMYGKPSTASGKISNFSGFLSGRVDNLVTTGMTDAEIAMVQSGLINDGIYI